ncbi:hypothetical protein MGG_00732 [Pyricularia oryzae 70-15]|uniref:Ecp2 effector protein domain-containing protein n=3 Tax=Pyricularia oryzae TaxID=318829 RepID=G4NEW0_PYRO7|nr:uncharacterized protein MGG_00732 [Pyricularia oryzae 70-15]ELQ36078.1 hypothetical protein OOU_Y34scaffold00669g63 [Pyricularia oryzae Y34]KAI7928907.1 hypothetical protein M9X92_001486 [Pyricularia oryzae]EHA48686.1 hypothetical protein MGG_00732 [Pyricularia oryzae 70-15]KAI7929640.1 hypothetical protein M0657_002117 [Pyricularia oryzae]QBZ62511.1 hypothetical protein PoMZ_11393 [Pyricularia oryzae]
MILITTALLATLVGSTAVPAGNITSLATLDANSNITTAAISTNGSPSIVSCDKYIAKEKGYKFFKDCSSFTRKVLNSTEESFDYLFEAGACDWWLEGSCLARFCAPDLVPWQLDTSQAYSAVKSIRDRCLFWGVSTDEYREGVAFFDVCAGTNRPCRAANVTVTFYG